MSTLKDMIRAMVEQSVAEVVSEMIANVNEPTRQDVDKRIAEMAGEMASTERKTRKAAKRGSFAKGPRVLYHVGRRMGQRELAEMRPNDRRAYDYVVKHAPCSAQQVENGTGLGRKATESALWSLRKGNNAGAIKSKPVA